ncbi:MAG: 1,4-alpha-glucan branching enzyme [Chlamydiae bacterium CG10_big_fil_rev_8_21_14_0_10_42_34]|nr:MAG: 1,4-alpha-glucan branching enzyme [Chlamydiae bacterium CG10_big_fil_rev_8_21_14_0_10_42_34]
MSTQANGSPDLALLAEGRHHNPHHFLGLHETPNGQVIRLWRPGAKEIYLEVLGQIVQATQVASVGLFEYALSTKIQPNDYRIYHLKGMLAHDPYASLPTFGEMDAFLFNKGCHYKLYTVLGSNVKETGTQFAVWAPSARSVSLVGDFNDWDGRICPMRSMGASGVWEIFIPGLAQGERYKFEIRTREGFLRIKSDPMAFYSELRPKTASVTYNVDDYQWKDANWKKGALNQPMNVYEVHLGSWRQYGTEFPNYRQIAVDLAKYCKEMGFTHVELLPVMEHPLDESWGYQVTGFFAATSRFGTPTDFQFFVDHMHQEGIGVFLDWVPAHFPTDEFSLNRFDGTAMYEHEDPKKGIHPHWHTAIFNYGRKEVTNFLIASALFWLDKMHIDGLRVDAVASMLYLDYGRQPGEWIPNPDGSNFNIEAIEFIKHLNSIVHEKFPGALMIAEESSSYIGVTHQEGLGFDLKWNMGWMNDTLRYFSKDPIYRSHHQNELTFSLLYAFSEKFMSVLSHDEVVHEKKSLLNKMPGPDWQKFANVRLLYSYFICHPGKNLIFMGAEVGQWNEWDCKGQIDWYLLQFPLHQGLQTFVRELNHFYLKQAPLWENDYEWQGYEWIDFSDAKNSVISYMRKGGGKCLACVHNFTPQFLPRYFIRLGNVSQISEVFNSDSVQYGGSNKLNGQIEILPDGFFVELAPLATMIFEVKF